MNKFTTSDLYDANEDNQQIRIVLPTLKHYGGNKLFYGSIRTIKTIEDNSLIRTMVGENGNGQVLVVDGGGSLNCALLGDQLAQKASDNNWSGVIINGCIRDSEIIAQIPIGVMAITTNPKKSIKRGLGDIDIPLIFLNCHFNTGEYIYADQDGIIVSPIPLI